MSKLNARKLIVGSWVSGDQYMSAFEIKVSRKGRAFVVRVVDSDDGEKADVFETQWKGEALTFSAYWNSTGRFTRYRLRPTSKDRVDLIYTHTDQETYCRKAAFPK